ncbi:MAG: hypothetical protein GX347_01325 [Epulopiscium sp.]|nr:hypothetical protein [Candidatus Epulonipiscium sp.]
MDNTQLINLATKTADIFIKNTTETIFRRIDAAKDDSDKEKTILRLEEIIKELIEERNELDKIIKEYDELLGMQKISEKDINYITENIVPIVSDFLESDLVSGDENINKDEINQIIDVLKPLLSIETFTILQLIGFNFREAIGIPLTKLVNKSIDKEDKENINYQYAVSVNKKEEELFKLLQTEEGRAIYKELTKPQES